MESPWTAGVRRATAITELRVDRHDLPTKVTIDAVTRISAPGFMAAPAVMNYGEELATGNARARGTYI